MSATASSQTAAATAEGILDRLGLQGRTLYRTATLRAIPVGPPPAEGQAAPAARAEGEGDPPAAEDEAKQQYRFDLSFSSEDPYLRWFGYEILGHKRGEVRVEWLSGGTAPLLMDHDARDIVGVVETAAIGAGRGRAVVRFGRSPRAEEIRADVLDGIRVNVSVGYIVHAMDLVSKAGAEDGPDTYRVTDWEPIEVSIVSVPADRTVGVGRSAAQQPHPPTTPAKETAAMETKAADPVVSVTTPPDPAQADRARQQAQAEHRNEMLQTIQGIQDLAAQHSRTLGDQAERLANEHIRKGSSLEAFRVALLDAITTKAEGAMTADHGLSPQEKRDFAQFSFVRALRAAAFQKPLTGIEAEMAIEGEREAKELGINTRGQIQIPVALLRARTMQRDLTVATEGTDIVATELGSMIDALRNRLILTRLGARMLSGLTGDVQFPRLSGTSTWAWEGETDAAAESTPTFDNVSLAPNRGGTYVQISRQTLLQSSPDVEAIVRDDLNRVAALGIQSAAIEGTGSSNQPEGILNVTGIGDVAGGENGLAPTWANIVDVTSEVAIDNADMGALGWAINAATRGKLMQTEKSANTGQFILPDLQNAGLVGYPFQVSNSVPSDLDKGTSTGVCSAAIFGNWNDLLIGMWGGYDLLVDPYTSAKNHLVEVHIGAYVDVAVRHAQSFAAIQDLLTT